MPPSPDTPKKKPKKMKPLTFRPDADVAGMLDDASKAVGASYAHIINECIRHAFPKVAEDMVGKLKRLRKKKGDDPSSDEHTH